MKKQEILFTGGYLIDSEITEFQTMVKETMGKCLTGEEAEDHGTRLIMLFEAMQRGSSGVPLSGIDAVDLKMKGDKNENN